MEQTPQKKAIVVVPTDIYSYMSRNIPFSFSPEVHTINCGISPGRGLKFLGDAIRTARFLTTVKFDSNIFTKKYSREIFNGLAFNTSVKKLHFWATDAIDETKIHVRSLTEMFKHNKTLETIEFLHSHLSFDVFAGLCDGLKNNDTVTCLICEAAELDDDKIELLAEMLLINRGLTDLRLDMKYASDGFATISQALQGNTSVRHVSLSNMGTDNYLDHVTIMARRTSLTELELTHCLVNDSERWISFFESLFSNDSLTSLKLMFCTLDDDCCRTLGDMLKVNTTLKTLELRDCKIEDEECWHIAEALKVNKTLTHLSLSNNLISAEDISEALKTNDSLKYLNLNHCGLDPELDFISDALVLNNSLTELHILGNVRIDGMLNIGQVLEINESIRVLHLEVPLRHDKQRIYFQEFLNSLKLNRTLTELNLRTDKPPQKSDGKLIAQTLKSNRAITKFELFGLGSNYDINRWLKHNKKYQQEFNNSTFSCIKMMALRPNYFLTIFPLEIWKLIFENIKCPGSTVNFGTLFSDVLKDPQTYFVTPMETE